MTRAERLEALDAQIAEAEQAPPHINGWKPAVFKFLTSGRYGWHYVPPRINRGDRCETDSDGPIQYLLICCVNCQY